MYGAMFGDYVGSVYEFDNIKTKDFPLYRERAGITDDSLMTVAVASACLDYAEHRDLDRFTEKTARELRRIARRYPFPIGGYGGKFLSWAMAPTLQPPYGSWGNGSAMRVSPCAWVADSLLEAEKLGRASAMPTHDHPDGLLGAKCTAGVVYLARTGASKAKIKQYVTQKFYPLDRTLDDIRVTYQFDGSCKGTAPVAIQAFLESTDFEDAIRNAISVGGDSDTIGAITGAIAEAFYGIPISFRNRVDCEIARWLHPDEAGIIEEFVTQFCVE